MPAETQVRQILVKVDTKGAQELREMSKQLGRISKDVSTLAGLGSLLQSALSFSFLGFGIKQITDMSDAIQNVESRIKVLTGSASEAKTAIEGILKVANETKTGFTDTAEVYSRLAVSLKATGLSTQSVLDLTQLLQNSFRLSGSTAQEAAGAIIQLSQAFTSGQLRGQELRSVMTQNAFVAQLLTKEFGTQESVYKQAERGAITVTKVLKLLFNNQDDINEKSKELSQTFSQTMVTALNSVQKAVFDLNKQFGISAKFAEGMAVASEKLGLILISLGTVAIPLITSKLIALGTVLLANPMTFFISSFAILAGLFISSFKNIDDFTNSMKLLGAAMVNTLASMIDIIRQISYFIPGINLITLALENILGLDVANGLRKYSAATKDAVEDNIKLEKTIADIQKTAEKEHKFLENVARQRALNALKDNRTGKELLADLNKAYLEGKVSVEEYYKAVRPVEIKKLSDTFKSGAFEVEKYVLELNKLKLTNLNRDFNAGKVGIYSFNEALNSIKLDELNFKFQSAKISFGEYREELLKLDAEKLGQQFALGEISVERYNKAIEENKLSELKLKLDQGKIAWREYRKEVDAVSTSLDSGGLIARGSERYLDSIGSKANQIADAIKNAFGSLENALLEFITTGTANFEKFAQSILEDINRIIIRAAIVGPIARGLTDAFTSTPTVAGPTSGTNGFTQGPGGGGVVISQKAGGGISLPGVPQPVYGANGEIISGQNASVIVNITNNTGSEVTQQESQGPNGERILDLIIQSKVKDGIASGSFDSAFGQSYGLRRRGV